MVIDIDRALHGLHIHYVESYEIMSTVCANWLRIKIQSHNMNCPAKKVRLVTYGNIGSIIQLLRCRKQTTGNIKR